MRKAWSGVAVPTTTTTAIAVGAGAGSTFTVADATGYPTGADPFVITINRGTTGEEKMLVTRSLDTFTISARAHDGTVAVDHASGVSVHHVIDAATVDEANLHANGNVTLHSSGTAAGGMVPVASGTGTITWDYPAAKGTGIYATVAPSTATQAVKDTATYVCDGVDDELEIEDALLAYPAVMLLDGTFNVRTSVTFPSPNRVLIGQSHGSIVKVVDGANANGVSALYDGNVCTNFTIDGNGSMQTATCMGAALGGIGSTFDNLIIKNSHYMGIQVVSNSQQFFILNCKILGTLNFHGIGVYGETTAITEHGTIAFNYVENTSKAGIAIQAVAQNITMGYNHTKNTGEDGVTGYNSLNRWIKITNNIMENPGNHGSHVGGNHYVFANNIIYNASFSGVFAYNNDGSTMYDTQMANNLIHITKAGNTGMGVYARNVDNCSITTNVIVDPDAHGITVQTCNRFTLSGNTVRLANTGIRVQGSSRSAITGNNINGTSGPGIYLVADGTVYCFYNSITGNQVSESSSNMIVEASGNDYNLVSSNVGAGNTSAISIVGTNSLAVNNIDAP